MIRQGLPQRGENAKRRRLVSRLSKQSTGYYFHVGWEIRGGRWSFLMGGRGGPNSLDHPFPAVHRRGSPYESGVVLHSPGFKGPFELVVGRRSGHLVSMSVRHCDAYIDNVATGILLREREATAG